MARTGKGDEIGRKTGRSGGRDERLKAALRENLRRRKAQERARKPVPAAAEGVPQEPYDPDSR